MNFLLKLRYYLLFLFGFLGLYLPELSVSLPENSDSNKAGENRASRLSEEHRYFDYLAAAPEIFVSRSYRNQIEIEQDRWGKNKIHNAPYLIYDKTVDAARFTIPKNVSGTPLKIKHKFQPVTSGNLLFTWEARWEEAWADKTNLQKLSTHKTFQLGRLASRSDTRRLEIRTIYRAGKKVKFDSKAVGLVNFRRYQWPAQGREQPMPEQLRVFEILPDTWIRYWVFVDFENLTMSAWIAIEGQKPVQLFDEFQYDSMKPKNPIVLTGLDSFWFQFSSSQNRVGPPLTVWGRNLQILRDITEKPVEFVKAWEILNEK